MQTLTGRFAVSFGDKLIYFRACALVGIDSVVSRVSHFKFRHQRVNTQILNTFPRGIVCRFRCVTVDGVIAVETDL